MQEFTIYNVLITLRISIVTLLMFFKLLRVLLRKTSQWLEGVEEGAISHLRYLAGKNMCNPTMKRVNFGTVCGYHLGNLQRVSFCTL